MKTRIKFAAFFLIAVFVFASCKKEKSVTFPPITPPITNNNKTPVANAGADISLNYDLQTCSTNPITLNSSASSDPDGTIVSYLWTGYR